MERIAMVELEAWKVKTNRKPLLLQGARQVGKTWLMKEFGRRHFVKTAYINFDDNERMAAVFEGNLHIERLISAIQIETGVAISPEDTLLVFDEVQEVPRALTSLKYFNENAPEYAIVAAGSLLGITLHPGTSFPVGKVEFLNLYPMSFVEYLSATDSGRYAELLIAERPDWDMIKAFDSYFSEALKHYFYIGGMPEAVAAFAVNRDLAEVRRIQEFLLEAYARDFSKHAPNEVVPRINMLWDSVPAQLARENRKFLYKLIHTGARAREYELAMQWLIDAGFIHKVGRVSKPDIPLAAYQDWGAYKIFMLDVGLLAAKSGLDSKTLLEGNRIFEEFKGALTEQYVLQQLIAECHTKPYYWSADSGTAEVDFIFQRGGEVVPLEVKSAENLKSKSLRVYSEKYNPQQALRTSMSAYRNQEWMTNIPLYAVSTGVNTLGVLS